MKWMQYANNVRLRGMASANNHTLTARIDENEAHEAETWLRDQAAPNDMPVSVQHLLDAVSSIASGASSAGPTSG